MKELLEHLAQRILPHGDIAEVREEVEQGTVRLTLITHPEDIGLAIGKNGKTAKALREILKIKAIQDNQRVYLDIHSSDEESHPMPEHATPTADELLG